MKIGPVEVVAERAPDTEAPAGSTNVTTVVTKQTTENMQLRRRR